MKSHVVTQDFLIWGTTPSWLLPMPFTDSETRRASTQLRRQLPAQLIALEVQRFQTVASKAIISAVQVPAELVSR